MGSIIAAGAEVDCEDASSESTAVTQMPADAYGCRCPDTVTGEASLVALVPAWAK